MMKEQGLALVESLLVIVVSAAIVFLLANLPNAMNLINKSKHLSLAREIVAKQIEDKRVTNYLNLVNDTTIITSSVDSRISALPNGSGTVLVEECPSSICTNGEHVKQVTVTINWKDNNKLQEVTLKTLIGEGGINQ